MSTYRIAIIVSQFNQEVTHGLLRGARDYLKENGVTVTDEHVYSAPGAFEIPLIAQKLGQSGKYDGVVCLGCVTKGDTAHFEYISETSGHGLMRATLAVGIPLTFGVLTTYTEQQARVRSQDDKHNKGREAAAACLESLKTLARIG